MIKEDKDFKAAVGEFIIKFTELEYGLAKLLSFTGFDIRRHNEFLTECMGLTFENKLRNLSKFIKNELPALDSTWTEIKEEIEKINTERRYIAHGIISYMVPYEYISASIKTGDVITSKDICAKSIHELSIRLSHINTGKNGVIGEFNTLFMKCRIDAWNNMVLDDFKLKYLVNSEILSEWKGK